MRAVFLLLVLGLVGGDIVLDDEQECGYIMCENNGTLDKTDCACVCAPGYTGLLCETEVSGSWPQGEYALPATLSGCPERDWVTGYVNLTIINTRNNVSRHYWTEGTNLLGPYHRRIVQLNFCSYVHHNRSAGDTFSDAQADDNITVNNESRNRSAPTSGNIPAQAGNEPWPPGSYCIYKYGDQCPDGFNMGSVSLKNYKALPGRYGGAGLPIDTAMDVGGGGTDGGVGVAFCCRHDDDPSTEIDLPTSIAFFMFKERNASHCQYVRDTDVKEELFSFLKYSEHLWPRHGEYPYVEEDNDFFNLTFCYYKTKARKECIYAVDFGASYNGRKNTTQGQSCLPWTSKPGLESVYKGNFENNYCRAMEWTFFTPVCYIAAGKREKCQLPICDDHEMATLENISHHKKVYSSQGRPDGSNWDDEFMMGPQLIVDSYKGWRNHKDRYMFGRLDNVNWASNAPREEPWVTIELGYSYEISAIILWRRVIQREAGDPKNHWERMYAWIGKQKWDFFNFAALACGSNVNMYVTSIYRIQCERPLIGSYVTIQGNVRSDPDLPADLYHQLHIGEVDIFGKGLSCGRKLGLQRTDVKKSQITATSYQPGYHFNFSRVNLDGIWCARISDPTKYITVHLLATMKVEAVVIQGQYSNHTDTSNLTDTYMMADSFRVKFGFRYETMRYYNDSHGPQRFYTSPIEEFGPTQTFYFGTPFLARIVGLEVDGDWPCLRMEWIVCKRIVERDCDKAPGVGWDVYPDHSKPDLPYERVMTYTHNYTHATCQDKCHSWAPCLSYEYATNGDCRLSTEMTEFPYSEPNELETSKSVGEKICLKVTPIYCNFNVTEETVIHSPNYPRLYDDNLMCTWNVYLASAVALNIDFLDINLFVHNINYTIENFKMRKDLNIRNPPFYQCIDYIEIQDNTDEERERIADKNHPNAKNARIITGGNNVTIRFRSCNNVIKRGQYRGFKLRITKSDCPRCVMKTSWETVTNRCSHRCGYIYTHYFPSNLETPNIHEYRNMEFIIERKIGDFIRFELIHFDMDEEENMVDLYGTIGQLRKRPMNVMHARGTRVFYTDSETLMVRSRFWYKTGSRGFLAKYAIIQGDQLGRALVDMDSQLCDNDWAYYNGSCFYLMEPDQEESQTAMQTLCREMDAQLATIKSMDVAEALSLYYERNTSRQHTTEILIGLERTDPRKPFEWSDGSIAVFHNWQRLWGDRSESAPGFPETVQTCVTIIDKGNRLISNWREDKCDEYQFALCEKILNQTNSATDPRTLPLHVVDTQGFPPAKAIFMCLTGEMIDLASRCDGKPQCSDGSDETNCTTNDGSCGDLSFRCLDGHACIPISRYCDFITDCLDASDEKACHWPACGPQQFQCEDGACIDAEWRCDLMVDCLDGSDESGCTKDTCTASRGIYDCGPELISACVPWEIVCDGYVDCPGGMDEATDDNCAIWSERPTCADWYRDGFRDQNRVYAINTGHETSVNVECIFDEDNGTVHTIYRHRREAMIPITTTRENLTFAGNYLDAIHSSVDFLQRFRMMVNDYNMTCQQTIEVQCYRVALGESAFQLRYHLDDLECSLYGSCRNQGRPLCEQPDNCKCIKPEYAAQQRFFKDTFVLTLDAEGPVSYVIASKVDRPGWASFKLGPVVCSQPIPEKPDTILCNNGYVAAGSSRCLDYSNQLGVPNGCRDKTHLLHCESFTCPYGFVKCPNSFCIALEKVCDGIPDCEYKQDELNCDVWNCPNQYRCRDSKKCLSRDKICDGKTDCSLGDDENMCNEICPDACTCYPGYIDCIATNFRVEDTKNVSSTVRSLNLHQTQLSFYDVSTSTSKHPFQNLVYLGELNISRCRIDFLYSEMFNGLGNLYLLDLSFNEFTSLPQYIFSRMVQLRNLYLTGNRLLSIINSGAFSGLSVLSSLDMSGMALTTLHADMWRGLSSITDLNVSSNQIYAIQGAAFVHVPNLRTLDLSNNKITIFDSEAFAGLEKLVSMVTDSFSFCCIRPNSVDARKCSPEPDQFSSCSNLLKNENIRAFMWLIGIFAVLGNALTLVFRVFFETESLKNSYGILVTNLCFSDILMGIYLLIISTIDSLYRGNYAWNDISWRNSSICSLAGVVVITSAECSILLLCLIALDRLRSIKFSSNTSPWSSVVTSAIVWMVALTTAIVPISQEPALQDHFEGSFYSVSGVCFQLPLTEERTPGTDFSVVIFILFNSVCFVMLVGAQSVTYYTVRKTKIMMESADRRNEFQVASRLGAMVFAKFITWCPICVLGIVAALGGAYTGAEVYMWMALVVLPLGAALDPIIYMYSSFSNSRAGRIVLQWAGILVETFPTETEMKKHRLSMRKLCNSRCILVSPQKHHLTLKDYFKQAASPDVDHPSADDIYRITFQLATTVLMLHDLGLGIGNFNESNVFAQSEYSDNKMVKQKKEILIYGLPRTVLDESDKYSNIASLGSLVNWMLKRYNVAKLTKKKRNL